jgi:hypothetical protein
LRARQDWALAQLTEWYLFPTLLNAGANPASYGTVDDYIDALTARPRAQNRDRYFTYLTSIAEEDAYYDEGETAGFGLRLGYDGSGGRVFVIEAFEGAPALAAGIDRGVELVQINGQTVSSLMASGGPSAVIDALGPDTAGTARSLVVRELSGVQRTSQSDQGRFRDRPGVRPLRREDHHRRRAPGRLPQLAQLHRPGRSQPARGLRPVQGAGGDRAGGRPALQRRRADLDRRAVRRPDGRRRTGQIFDYITFRDSKASENESYAFHAQPEGDPADQVAPSSAPGGTASASEMVINGMVPYLGANMALVAATPTASRSGRSRSTGRDATIACARSRSSRERQSPGRSTSPASLRPVPPTCRASRRLQPPARRPDEDMMVASRSTSSPGAACTAIAGVTQRSGRPRRRAAERLLSPEVPASTIKRELPGAF